MKTEFIIGMVMIVIPLIVIPLIVLAIILVKADGWGCLFFVYGFTIVVLGWSALAGRFLTGGWFK